MSAIPEHLASEPVVRLRAACTTWTRDLHTLTACCGAPMLRGLYAGQDVATACPDCDGYWPAAKSLQP